LYSSAVADATIIGAVAAIVTAAVMIDVITMIADADAENFGVIVVNAEENVAKNGVTAAKYSVPAMLVGTF
jgi:alpha-D-ribose 1-methylphosphonate 5-phosphate C-P lyase